MVFAIICYLCGIMKNILFTLLSLLLLPMVFACGNGEESASMSKTDREVLRREDSAAFKVGVLPTEDCLPIVVAKELHLFDTLGVSVHLRHYHALSECRIALRDSLVQGAVIDSVLMNEMIKKGTPLYKGITTGMQWKFLTARKARITRLEQLADKTIAADSHGESHRLAEMAIDSLQKKGQLVFIVQVEDLDVRLKMLGNGNVDAALLPEPYATKAQEQGANVIDRVKSKPAGVLALRSDAMKPQSRKDQYKVFLKAIDIAKDSIQRYGKEKYMHLLRK